MPWAGGSAVEPSGVTQPFLLDAARAAVDPAKLRDCCPNPDHARGRYKARAFRAALGLVQADAPWLREAILAAVRTAPAVPEGSGRYGERRRVDLALTCRGRSAIVRTIWLIGPAGGPPRLVTCLVF